MKSYRTETTLHIVGKAWQIQTLLRQWQKEYGPTATIASLTVPKKVQI
ncbi:Z-ring formation inhibitor MciZ [Paenibacillus sp. CMAA1739]|uniref:Z-ring formation inhibitor MciZ n=1 Tax=Paenibacillus ottowii TaxID=2315729 RepID=A0ABY3B8K4_9BACL|nr:MULTISPECIES: Z-ring formation inhibitor MciZ [Paenibacillus]MDP1508776.1 Z-ring formation inhibitor MciZ [Paenibacillus ottowii]MEC4565100.1 Z-ring formation inhibitor MciZ [Paenibacillus sp. CMAA1739]NEU28304.1 Z-ring formation inhibitor MciZ [Paenibacillus polymyxa]TQS00349.1 Z-ring formation inhibitor MciZ [Paenibacillus ottowii]